MAMKGLGQLIDKSKASLHGSTTGPINLVGGSIVVIAYVGDPSISLWGKKKSGADDGAHLKCMSTDHHLHSPRQPSLK